MHQGFECLNLQNTNIATIQQSVKDTVKVWMLNFSLLKEVTI